MVVNLFSGVKDKSAVAPRWEDHPFVDSFGTYVYMHPIKDVRNLNLIFPCPDLQKYYKSSVSKIFPSYGRYFLQFCFKHKQGFSLKTPLS